VASDENPERYKILSADRGSDLVISVNAFLADGWTLAGGVAVVPAPSGTRATNFYYQAITREEGNGDGSEEKVRSA
jgi:hypothetical protein